MVNDCPAGLSMGPAGLETPTGGRNCRKAGVRMQRNPSRYQTDQVRKETLDNSKNIHNYCRVSLSI